MSSRRLVDPELLAALDYFPTSKLSVEALPSIRAAGAAAIAAHLGQPDVSEVSIEDRAIRTPAGHDIGVVIHTPRATAVQRPAVLHIHGGGYFSGSAQSSKVLNQWLAAAAACVVVSVEYRLAPESRHPGPVEDCYAGLKWLHDNIGALGVDPGRIAVMGESAGGGLAAALALLALDRGEISLCHQHLNYPMLDDRTCVAAEPHPYAGEFVWTLSDNLFGWSALLGRPPGGEGVSAYAAPARAEHLAGLPSTFISVGALDLFVQEDIEYARRLMRAGVPTELHVYPGAYHAFEVSLEFHASKQARHTSITALRRALHPS